MKFTPTTTPPAQRSELSRRDILRAGLLGIGGLTLADLLRLRAEGAAAKSDTAGCCCLCMVDQVTSKLIGRTGPCMMTARCDADCSIHNDNDQSTYMSGQTMRSTTDAIEFPTMPRCPIRRTVLTLAGLLFLTPALADEPDNPALSPRVREVIAAAGGEEKLLKLFRFDERVLITATPTPLKPDDKPNRTSTVEVGGNWWIGAKKRDKDKVRVLCYAWSLRVLLDPKSKIEALPDAKIGDVPVIGLRVHESIAEPLELWFDAEKKQLIAIDYTNTRHIFSEWKKTGAGHHYPSHVTGYRFTDRAAKTTNEKQWYQTDILSLKPLDELPPNLE